MSNHPISGVVLIPVDHFLVSLRDAIVVSFVREKNLSTPEWLFSGFLA